MSDSFSLSEMMRRLANIVRIGVIAETNDSNVKVQIDRIKTPWIPVLSQAGETDLWIPISIGEQVLVISPFGEMSQAVALRSVHYDKFQTPDDKNKLNLTTSHSCKIHGEKDIQINFQDGIEIKSGDAMINIKNGAILLKSGDAMIHLSSGGMSLELGASRINISPDSMHLMSQNLSSSPPFCKCGGL